MGEAVSAPPEIIHLPTSPDKFCTDLADTGRLRIRDVTEAAVADVPARIHELRMVEYVEEFAANLDRHGLPDGKDFRNSEVRIVEPRAMEEPAVRCTESSAVGAGSGPSEIAVSRDEGVLVEICVGSRGRARVVGVNWSHQIRHIGGGTASK